MSASPTIIRRPRHLRVFLISLGVLCVGLAVFVFGVSMEATATARGHIVASGVVEVRAPNAGRIVPDWRDEARKEFPKPGDHLKKGSGPLAVQPIPTVEGMTFPTLSPPDDEELWLVTAVHVQPGEVVSAGQRLMTLVPLDPQTKDPRELLVLLEVNEEHAAEVRPKQKLRVVSNLFNERTHGKLEAEVLSIEPTAQIGDEGKRRYRVLARLEDRPISLLLGSSVKAEIVLGMKPVYRIILEH